MIDHHRPPSERELVVFGLVFLVFSGLVGVVLRFAMGCDLAIAAIPWTLGVLLVAVYFAVPASRRPLYRGWIIATFPLSWLGSHIVLGFTYYVVLTPIALGLRLAGRDPLRRRIDRAGGSAWIERGEPPEPRRYFRQF